MDVLVRLLLWTHFLALALGLGGGLGMAQVGPRLKTATPAERTTLWPLAEAFGRLSGIGLVLLLVTGPLMLALKYNGGAGLNVWFQVKLALVAVAVVTAALSFWGKARLKKGDLGGGKLMAITGPLTTLTVLAVVLAAVLTFD